MRRQCSICIFAIGENRGSHQCLHRYGFNSCTLQNKKTKPTLLGGLCCFWLRRQDSKRPLGYELRSAPKVLVPQGFLATVCPIFGKTRRSNIHSMLSCPLADISVWVKTRVKKALEIIVYFSGSTSDTPCGSHADFQRNHAGTSRSYCFPSSLPAIPSCKPCLPLGTANSLESQSFQGCCCFWEFNPTVWLTSSLFFLSALYFRHQHPPQRLQSK